VFHSEMWFEQLVPPNNYLWKPRFRALHLAGRTNSIFSCDIKYNIFSSWLLPEQNCIHRNRVFIIVRLLVTQLTLYWPLSCYGAKTKLIMACVLLDHCVWCKIA